jgi:molybdopterin-dependent oxidoreductase-like protein
LTRRCEREVRVDLHGVLETVDARGHRWRPGDVWLAGGTFLFSEPQPHARRLVDLTRTSWPPVHITSGGALEIAATCTVAELARYPQPLFGQCCRAFLASFKIWSQATVGGNLCNALPAGPMISLTAALDGECLLLTIPSTWRSPGTGRPVGSPKRRRPSCCRRSHRPPNPTRPAQTQVAGPRVQEWS